MLVALQILVMLGARDIVESNLTPRFFAAAEGEIWSAPIVTATVGVVLRGVLEKSKMSVLSH